MTRIKRPEASRSTEDAPRLVPASKGVAVTSRARKKPKSTCRNEREAGEELGRLPTARLTRRAVGSSAPSLAVGRLEMPAGGGLVWRAIGGASTRVNVVWELFLYICVNINIQI